MVQPAENILNIYFFSSSVREESLQHLIHPFHMKDYKGIKMNLRCFRIITYREEFSDISEFYFYNILISFFGCFRKKRRWKCDKEGMNFIYLAIFPQFLFKYLSYQQSLHFMKWHDKIQPQLNLIWKVKLSPTKRLWRVFNTIILYV